MVRVREEEMGRLEGEAAARARPATPGEAAVPMDPRVFSEPGELWRLLSPDEALPYSACPVRLLSGSWLERRGAALRKTRARDAWKKGCVLELMRHLPSVRMC